MSVRDEGILKEEEKDKTKQEVQKGYIEPLCNKGLHYQLHVTTTQIDGKLVGLAKKKKSILTHS